VRDGDWKYIETVTTGERELYNIADDPYEMTNLAGLPEYEAKISELQAEMAQLRG
jgi:choline-sulfatase